MSSTLLVFPRSVLATNALQGLSQGILEKSWLSSGRNGFADAKEGSGRDQRGAEHLPSRTRVEAGLAQDGSFSPIQTHLSLFGSPSIQTTLESQPALPFPWPQRSLGKRRRGEQGSEGISSAVRSQQEDLAKLELCGIAGLCGTTFGCTRPG